MSKVTLTNTTKALQGVHDVEGVLHWIKPGSQKTVVPQDPERIGRQKLFTVEAHEVEPDHNGDGHQSTDDLDDMKVPALKALAEAEGVDLQGSTKRDDIIAAIRLDREAKAAT